MLSDNGWLRTGPGIVGAQGERGGALRRVILGLRTREQPCCQEDVFYIPDNRPITDGFRRKISMKLFYQYMAIF